MGADLQHDDCSIHISQPAVGLLNINSDFLGLNGELFLKRKNEEIYAYGYTSLSTIGKPGESNLKSFLTVDELYDSSSSSPALTFELTKSSTSNGEESVK